MSHYLVLNHILDFLYRSGSVELFALVLDIVCSLIYLILRKFMKNIGFISLCDSYNYFIFIEFYFGTISLDYFHIDTSGYTLHYHVLKSHAIVKRTTTRVLHFL